MSEPEGRLATVAVMPFDEVYARYAARVYRFCLSQLRNPSEAEDVAAEVFVSALAAYARTLPDPDGVLTWLLRIARNAIVDHRRRAHRWSALLARFFSQPATGVDVEDLAVLRAELRVVLTAASRLNGRDRMLLGLRLAAGLSHAEIGATMNLSEHAATMAVRRAVQRLRRHCEVGR